MENVHEVNMKVTDSISLMQAKKRIPRWKNRLTILMSHWMLHKGVLHILVSILLGRALFLSQFTPFALPMFAVIFMVSRNKALMVMAGLVLGASTLGIWQGVYTFSTIALFYFGSLLVKNKMKENRFVLAGTVALSVVIARTIYLSIELPATFTWVDGVMVAFEAALAGILTLVFLQGMQLITKARKRTYAPEEMVAIAIVVASIATGLIGFTVGGLAIDHIITRYVVIVAALAAGAMVGSTVGIVTGLVFCLASVNHLPEVAVLAVAGLLGGLMKSGKATGVTLGLMMATLLMGLFMNQGTLLEISLYESALAGLAVFLTPKRFLFAIARHIPGSAEHEQDQQSYARNVRDVTAEKVQKFSDMFDTLSKSFQFTDPGNESLSKAVTIDNTLSRVTENTCQMCFKKDYCWSTHFDRTYEWMKDLADPPDDHKPPKAWQNLCVKAEQVQSAFLDEAALRANQLQMKKQMMESNQFVSNQLRGLSSVMKDFAVDLQRETEKHDQQEDEMLQALNDFGINVDNVDVHSMDYGHIDVDVMLPFVVKHGECEKLIAPMLSSILKETIVVHQKVELPSPYEGMVVTFRSSKAFKVSVGIAHAAHGGGLISGDSHAAVHLHGGKYAIAISDGMGNGEKAKLESDETIQLLRQMLQAGIEEELAIKSVNSILTVKRTGDMYSTVDLAMIDLQNAKAKFLKVGSVPSYIKRGKTVKTIEAGNLPMGFFSELEMEVLEDQLKAGDLLIMLSDGVLDGPRFIENPERWIKRQISELKTAEPQEVADILMEAAVRTSGGEIEDDMTIMAVQIQREMPKWAAIPAAIKTG
ncbi:stage II sporulation protein E [Jeotgalibacillus proteolyticus]|uniref:Stage II sporulation protein E n=1 Tax=Jeotgalibacillus proteolyticus TaxID=2082395 RepID=A0A2S5G6E0_9BACL|nr:stage II sporulation protein E [Jeotgalibacillus proteolyticus]PPA68549.1 stage II sporulation protein E [Jeotgalibacillus proteolyticus]